MSTKSSVYLGFADGASHHTHNLFSSTWVVYSLKGLLVSLGGVLLGPSMNNVVEYSTIIELLHNAISHGIRSLEVCLDSQLVVRQLNGHYCTCDPNLLR
jgi:ribonuclease HI